MRIYELIDLNNTWRKFMGSTELPRYYITWRKFMGSTELPGYYITWRKFMGSTELPGYYNRFSTAFYYGFDDPCNVDLFRCRDCYQNNLHKPSMELPGSRLRNYLETTSETTWKVPKELPGNCGYPLEPTLVNCPLYRRKLLLW